ncbi:hypothetical protein Tco_1577621 [Tanacetum coccineum]
MDNQLTLKPFPCDHGIGTIEVPVESKYEDPIIHTGQCCDIGHRCDTSKRPPSQDPYEVTATRRRSRVAARSLPPSSPTHDSPSTRQILLALPGLPRRPVVLVLPGVGPLPTHRLALRYSADYSSSDHFTSDDSSRDSPSDSSSKTSSDSHSDTSSDTSSRHSSSVPVASSVPEALSLMRADLLPPRKRIRDSDSVTDFEVSSEEDYVPQIAREADIDACVTFVDDIAARGTYVRVEVGTEAKEKAESSARGMIEIGVDRVTHLVVSDDIAEPELYDHMIEIPVHRVRVIESVQGDHGHRIMASSQQGAAMSEMISTLEWDNMRLIGMLNV